jgi:hypothetical protein
MVVAKFRDRLKVNKQRSQRFHMERFKGKERYCVEVSNRFAASGDFDTVEEINNDWEMIREY